MKKAQEVMTPESCFNRAHPGEYLFVLLGRDICTPDTIRFWATERMRLGKNSLNDPQIQEAFETARAIEEIHAKDRAASKNKR